MQFGDLNLHILADDDLKAADGDVDCSDWRRLLSDNGVQAYCQAWLDMFTRQFKEVNAALVLVRSDETIVFVPFAVGPNQPCDMSSLATIAQRVLEERQVVEVARCNKPTIPGGMSSD